VFFIKDEDWVMSPYHYQWRHSIMLWVVKTALDASHQECNVREG